MTERILNEFLIQWIIDNREILITGAIMIGKEILEYWLGRTEKVQAGSTLELILLFVKRVKNAIKN